MLNKATRPIILYLALAVAWLGGVLGGCNSIIAAIEKAPVATVAPTPESVTVVITPAARTLWGKLHECALAHPELALILWERPSTSPDFRQADLSIRLGAPPAEEGYLALLGETEIKVIVHPSSAFADLVRAGLFGNTANYGQKTDPPLTLQEIKTIFQKGYTASGQPLQVWILQGDDVRRYFDAVILDGTDFLSAEVAPQARIAPDPAAMLVAVSSDPAAIGYLPATWLDDEVHPLVLDNALSLKLRLPILALAKAEPQGVSRTLLGCLQAPAGASK
jgi:hypothetical protein